MFVQIIQGQATDPEHVLTQMDRWHRELQPGATGFLGDTAGIGNDRTVFVMARFESEQAARANSDRPEQGEWWAETAKGVERPVFVDSTDVRPYLGGGSDDAGFVQVIQGAVGDRPRFEALFEQVEARLPERRPDLLGGVLVWSGDTMTQLAYFTSEDEARRHEPRADEIEGEEAELLGEWRSLISDVRYIDLSDPRMTSA